MKLQALLPSRSGQTSTLDNCMYTNWFAEISFRLFGSISMSKIWHHARPPAAFSVPALTLGTQPRLPAMSSAGKHHNMTQLWRNHTQTIKNLLGQQECTGDYSSFKFPHLVKVLLGFLQRCIERLSLLNHGHAVLCETVCKWTCISHTMSCRY